MLGGMRLEASKVLVSRNSAMHQLELTSSLSHPLDFDWRFTFSTSDYLWRLAHHLTDPWQRVVLLGTPSLAVTAMTSMRWTGPIRLLERKAVDIPFVGDRIEFLSCDILRDPIQRVEGGLVIADPPWYEEETTGFLWAASYLCRAGGYVVVSMPPVGTRPAIEHERARINEAAAGFGLRSVSVFAGVLSYATPFFEMNATRAAGTWAPEALRRGDLAIYLRMAKALGPRPPAHDEARWIERLVGNTRIRLKQVDCVEFASPTLQFRVTFFHRLAAAILVVSMRRLDFRQPHFPLQRNGDPGSGY